MEEEKAEEEKRKRRHEEELKLEEAKMQINSDFEKNMEEEPKLTITKFQGTHLDWLRFWSQFETEIDKATITQLAKFSYLKELLVSKVRSLPSMAYLTTLRDTNVLRLSWVANAHIQSIIALPTVQGSQPARVHDFYERLATNV